MLVRKRSLYLALSAFTVLILSIAAAYSANADTHIPPYIELNNGQFRVDYLGIHEGDKDGNNGSGWKTVTYAVTNQGCYPTANLDPSSLTTGNGKGKGGGPKEPKEPREPKCAGMSHFSVGFENDHSLREIDLIDPADATGDCDCYNYTTLISHPMCNPGTEYDPGISYDCIPGDFKPTYGWSGATKFPGLKFSKALAEPSLPKGQTFIFHITYQNHDDYVIDCVDVLIKPGNNYYWGPLLGPVLSPSTEEPACAPNPKTNWTGG